jgi:hypothetical protein
MRGREFLIYGTGIRIGRKWLKTKDGKISNIRDRTTSGIMFSDPNNAIRRKQRQLE